MSSVHIEMERTDQPSAVVLMFADGSFVVAAPGADPTSIATTLVDVAFRITGSALSPMDVTGRDPDERPDRGPYDVESQGL